MFGILNDDAPMEEKRTRWEKKQDAIEYAEDRERERKIGQATRYLKAHSDIAEVVKTAAEMIGSNLARLKLDPDIELRVLKKHKLDLNEVFNETLEAFKIAYERMVEVEDIMERETSALEEERDKEAFTRYDEKPPIVPDKQELIENIKEENK